MNITKIIGAFGITSQSAVSCLVSGGIDSMVLFYLLCRARQETPFNLSVLHFNFHLRGEESNRDEFFVREQAEKAGISCRVVDAPMKKGSGVQERARNIRLDYLCQNESGWTHAVLAHQADDQAETVLMRLIRGTGLRGLCGIEPQVRLKSGLMVIRPLLSCSREDIQKFAQKEKIPFVEDSSNAGNDYLRNRVRHSLMPVLRGINPDFVSMIGRKAEEARKEFGRHQKEAENFTKACIDRPVEKKHYFGLSDEARFLVVEKLLQGAGFNKQVESRHFLEIEHLLSKRKSFERIYGEAFLAVKSDQFRIGPSRV